MTLERKTPMKPGKPLRRTPFKASRVQRVTAKPLPPVSKKRQALNKIRTKMLRPHRLDPQICAVPWCDQVGDSPHEPLTRARGGSIVDPDNLVMVCWPHNQELTLEPAWGYDLGLLRHSWKEDPNDDDRTPNDRLSREEHGASDENPA